MDRKHTAWKKSRKFGDVKGGRRWPKFADGLLRRVHSFKAPSQWDELPIVRVDNPSRDFFFPLSAQETLHELRRLPAEHVAGITHLWLRRFKKSEYERGEKPLASFMCGRGVRMIVLYPWPKDRRLWLGTRKPSARVLKLYEPYSEALVHGADGWCLEFTDMALKDLYTEFLLFHEVGHHIDWYTRHWSKANKKQLEEFADQYAFERTSLRTTTYRNRPDWEAGDQGETANP